MPKLSDLIGPAFYDLHLDIKENKYSHYWCAGGRGSLKSSFISIEIVLGIMNDPEANGTVFRKVKDTCRKSVYEQLIWAVEMLGVKEHWHLSLSPLELTYLPTGQKILIRGADNANKVKAAKFAKGYCKFIWYEELDEFESMAEIRKINQTLLRGGDKFVIFYSYNPPQSINSWVNAEAQYNRKDRIVHLSTYLDAPPEWLGKPFLLEAEELKQQNPRAYEHEMLGVATGTGGEVFLNVKLKEMKQSEIDDFHNVVRGIDWGFSIDPLSYVQLHYDRKNKAIYIFDEIYGVGISNADAIRRIKLKNPNNEFIIGDSAEPKSLHEFRQAGMRMKGAKKGKDSVNYGIKFLQDLYTIYIDEKRAPNTAKEFLMYELEKDAYGEFKAKFPENIPNHSIDAVRYALNDEIMRFKDRKQDKSVKEFKRRAEIHDEEIAELISGDAPKEFFQW